MKPHLDLARTTPHRRASFSLVPGAIALACLAACGGSGGDGGDSSGGSTGGTGGTGTTGSSSTPLVVSGTASNGAAIAGAPVDAKCAGGSASGTTGSDGSYSVTLPAGAALPCALRVTAASGALHGMALGSGASASADTTPVTDLAVAQMAGTAPATWYAGYDASALKASAAQTAATAVVTTLKNGGVDFSGVADVLSAPAGSGSVYAQQLAALQSAMGSGGTTLAAMESAVARASPAAAASTLSNAASLPPDLLLKPAAANCPALRSGRYRIVVNSSPESGDGYATQLVSIDAATLAVTDLTQPQGGGGQLVAAGTCRYTTTGGARLTVSAAGVIVGAINYGAVAAGGGAVIFPEQAHTVAELAGTWNALGWDTIDPSPVPVMTSFTYTQDAAGALSAITYCADMVTCQAVTPVPTFTHTVNAAGGFDRRNATDGWTERVFAYRAGGGEMLLVSVSDSGNVGFATRKVARGQATVGTVSEGWQIAWQGNTTAPYYAATTDLTAYKNTVTSVDAATSSYVRANVINTTTGVTRPETMLVNSPRDGYVRRPAATVTASNGASSTYGEIVLLPLRGMDLTAVGVTSTRQLLLSAAQVQ